MRRLVVILGLAAALALTACGGGGDDEDAAPAQTTAAPSTTAAIGNDQAGTPFCGLARTYTEKFNTLLTVINDPAKLRAATTDAESAIRQAQAQAPAEIRSDVNVVATTANQVLTGLQKNNFDVGKTSEISKLSEPTFSASLGKLNAYARAHCGVA
jgi:hypothetical protein